MSERRFYRSESAPLHTTTQSFSERTEREFDAAIDNVDYLRARELGTFFVRRFFDGPEHTSHYRPMMKGLAVPLYQRYYYEGVGTPLTPTLSNAGKAIYPQAIAALGEGLAQPTNTRHQSLLIGSLAELTVFSLVARQLHQDNDQLYIVPTTVDEDQARRDSLGLYYGVDFMAVDNQHRTLPLQVKNASGDRRKRYHPSITTIRLHHLVGGNRTQVRDLQYALIDENDDHDFDKPLVEEASDKLYTSILEHLNK